MTPPPDKRKQNLRTALILVSIVVVFFVGFIARRVFLG